MLKKQYIFFFPVCLSLNPAMSGSGVGCWTSKLQIECTNAQIGHTSFKNMFASTKNQDLYIHKTAKLDRKIYIYLDRKHKLSYLNTCKNGV